MLDMTIHAIRLFFAGKLFRDNLAFFRQWGLGLLVSLLLIGGLGALNLWLGVVVGGALSGALLPWLLKDLKYN